jgi:uncharacterized LabA/DUF88 family protein
VVGFCKQFISDAHTLVQVKYFTAPPLDNQKRSKQSAFFNANKLMHGEMFNIINGQYQNKQINCKKCRQVFVAQEEKRTDVNISVNMIMDCVFDRADILILVSADSDQVPTVQAIKTNFPHKKVKVYFPPQRNSTALFNISKPIVFLGDNEKKFANAVMPATVTFKGKTYTRPANWTHK